MTQRQHDEGRDGSGPASSESIIPPFLTPRLTNRASLRDLLKRPTPTLIPGATDPLLARLAERAGFQACFLPGAGIANSRFGVPDVGLIGLRDVAQVTHEVARGVSIPLLVDADTGYGNAISVMHTVAELISSGAAGVIIEDQVFPKRCGHFEGKRVIPESEMVQKVRAAVVARAEFDSVLIARTDARQVEGIEAAIDRALRYAEAGADMVFVEAPESEDEVVRIARRLAGVPIALNMVEGGKTPLMPLADLGEIGFKFIIYANLALRIALSAVQSAFEHLHATGDSRELLPRVMPWAVRQDLVLLPTVQGLERRFDVPAGSDSRAAAPLHEEVR